MYPTITCSSSLPQGGRYMEAADSGYDDHHKSYNLSIDRRGFESGMSCIRNIQQYFK